MPVIGRLDEQVGRVLIDPVSKRRGPEEARPAASHTPPADQPREPEGTEATHDDRPEGRPPGGELPVWLL